MPNKILPFLLVILASLQAHHFKGLPHFSYFENYPQIPQEEFLGQAGDYEFSMVLYDLQGIQLDNVEMPKNVRFFLMILNLRENSIYGGEAVLQILDGDDVIVEEIKTTAEEENIYPMSHELGASGDYSMRVIMKSKGIEASIPFTLSSQKTSWGKWISLVMIILVVVAAYGSRQARIRKDRVQAAQ